MTRHLLALCLLLACRRATDAPPEGWTDVSAGPPLPAGACRTGADCPSGVCEGQGCGDDALGACVEAARACTRDLVTWCGCDGQTFQSSGSCPGRRYAHRGACVDAAP